MKIHVNNNLILLAILVTGCNGITSTTGITPSAAPSVMTASLAPTLTAAPAAVEKPELGSLFQGYTGAFVLYDLNTGQTTRYNPQGCAERLLPFSTFKLLNSLISLETGVVPDENYLIPWDGKQYPTVSWNQDQTMKTAIQNSVVWYFQELARRVGRERMQEYISKVGYGNQDISGQIDSFWLVGGLRISADEQIAFLKRLYQNDLPFSQRSMEIVRRIIVQEQTDTYQLSGKTGSGKMGDNNVAWFVGYVEANKHDVYFFATHIASPSQDVSAARAKEISRAILQDLGTLP